MRSDSELYFIDMTTVGCIKIDVSHMLSMIMIIKPHFKNNICCSTKLTQHSLGSHKHNTYNYYLSPLSTVLVLSIRA